MAGHHLLLSLALQCIAQGEKPAQTPCPIMDQGKSPLKWCHQFWSCHNAPQAELCSGTSAASTVWESAAVISALVRSQVLNKHAFGHEVVSLEAQGCQGKSAEASA